MTTSQDDGAFGNPALLEAGQVLLPGFVARREGGLYVDLAALDSRELLLRFVERVFAGGARFVDLDYPLLLKLGFESSPQDMAHWLDEFEAAGKTPEVRLCADVVPFPAERQSLYRGLKVAADGTAAEYLFEPLVIDREIEVPVAVESGVPGAPPMTQMTITTISERARLDFDEFVAALWLKGLRYGIDAVLVRSALAPERPERLTIARRKEVTPGRDASIEERCDALHRDDTPRILPDGRMDLRKFRNRFPQVTAETPLVQKLARVDGISGWSVGGAEITPPLPKDFDIATLAGPGTRIVRSAQGEFIVAARDGFLNIDTRSSQIAITEKIVSHEGVSARTTGDLDLAGDEFEEHGEVQEQRVVEGHHMTFFADVFGEIRSNGGRVVFKRGISGGSATSTGGSIRVEGSASRARLEAKHGTVEVALAENTLIAAHTVRIGRAVRCQIVAAAVDIDRAEGCAIAARNVHIGTTAARRDEGTVVSLLMPDLERFAMDIEAMRKDLDESAAATATALEEIARLGTDPELKTYLAVQAKMENARLARNAVQERQWQSLKMRAAPRLQVLAKLDAKARQLQALCAEYKNRIDALQQKHSDALAAVRCVIDDVKGETRVRRRTAHPDAPSLANLGARELLIALREAGEPDERIFTGDSGSVCWPPPVDPA